MAPGRLADKVVLLSGTGSGMGRAAALLFAQESAKVVGCDINVQSADETAALLDREGLAMDSVAPIDLSDREQVRQWVDAAVARHGRIDVLYNNASLPRFAPFAEMSVEDYRFTVANELDVVWHPCQIAWPHLAASRGAIVNVGSIAGMTGTRELRQAAHVSTKGAVIALTRQLAAEGVAFGIRANSVSPGVIATPPVVGLLEAMGEDAPVMPMVRQTIDGAPGQPIDVAYAALYLASDEARWVTGANLVVDGGTTAIV